MCEPRVGSFSPTMSQFHPPASRGGRCILPTGSVHSPYISVPRREDSPCRICFALARVSPDRHKTLGCAGGMLAKCTLADIILCSFIKMSYLCTQILER